MNLSYDRSEHEARWRMWSSRLIILLLFALAVWQAGVASVAVRKQHDTEIRFESALRGSQQGLWSWRIPESEAEWPTSQFWAGPNFQAVIGHYATPIEPRFDAFLSIVHPADREKLLNDIRRTITNGDTFKSEYQIKTSTGVYVWLRVRGQYQVKDNGEVVLSGSLVDVTNEYMERFRANLIVNSSSVAVIMCNEQHQITVFNPAAERLFGYKATDMLGQPVDLLLTPAFREQHRALMHASMLRIKEMQADWQVARDGVQGQAVHKSGRSFDLIVDIRAIKYRGQVEFIAVVQLPQAAEQPAPIGNKFDLDRTEL